LRILVVDDNEGARQTYVPALRSKGYDVACAGSGRQAIDFMRSTPFEALLLDIRSGDITSNEVIQWMRREHRLVPTAVMTARSGAFEATHSVVFGVLAHIDHSPSGEEAIALVGSLTKPPCVCDTPGQLHTRVLAGSPGALECLDALFLRRSPPRLQRAFPGVPWDFTIDATVDASLGYAAAPSSFDPLRLPDVIDFVYLIARRNLANRLSAERQRRIREEQYAREHAIGAGSRLQHEIRELWRALVVVTDTSAERRAIRCWLDGGSSHAVAGCLGVGDLPTHIQQREVKRFKDRVLKRLSRYFAAQRSPTSRNH
jgi:CheY-like chemotaxis protein